MAAPGQSTKACVKLTNASRFRALSALGSGPLWNAPPSRSAVSEDSGQSLPCPRRPMPGGYDSVAFELARLHLDDGMRRSRNGLLSSLCVVINDQFWIRATRTSADQCTQTTMRTTSVRTVLTVGQTAVIFVFDTHLSPAAPAAL
jgi:hypothetical protein